ncbi:reticulocalbin-2 [Eurytemora carolleeae]|uniref:reticulocalbin-2 n=1 Tax=Eurytemora carolleeae TaxID=1294199 RepID=UPI000C790ED6|nr:reticulocalbin-2 [Eurytemora carolleeae]|eukprot:XP_023324145.1 reticulocalbin-2-like [Eurytemora affinis]
MNVWIVGVGILCSVQLSNQAAHSHTHGQGSSERVSDGAYSPRDHRHGAGDQHDVGFDHEAILGSRKEAEEFDDLSPEEAKKRLKVLLEKMDRNLDQSVDRKELYAWILRSFKSLSKEDSDDRFEDCDENEDGKVSWEEYKTEEYDFGEGEINLSDPDIAEEWKLMEEDRFLFLAADFDQDGFLDKVEFLAFAHPEEEDKMKPVVVEQVLKAKDINGDGSIDFQEYLGSRGEGKDKEWLLSEKDRFDTELDKNQDNLLSKEEILAWIIPSNEDIASEEVNHLFAGADTDVDGVLSFQEILNNHELFVGSEATDYGDHLHNLDRFKEEL